MALLWFLYSLITGLVLNQIKNSVNNMITLQILCKIVTENKKKRASLSCKLERCFGDNLGNVEIHQKTVTCIRRDMRIGLKGQYGQGWKVSSISPQPQLTPTAAWCRQPAELPGNSGRLVTWSFYCLIKSESLLGSLITWNSLQSGGRHQELTAQHVFLRLKLTENRRKY